MKKYICPDMKAEEAEASQMLAESLVVNSDTTVDGGDALTKGADDWAIWDEE